MPLPTSHRICSSALSSLSRAAWRPRKPRWPHSPPIPAKVRGVSYGLPRDRWTEQLAEAGRLQIAPNPDIAYRMLQGGRFSAFFAIPLQYEKELADRGLRDQMTIVDWFPSEPPTPRNLALSRKNFTPEQLAAWNTLVKTLRTDGAMQAILQRYLTPAEAARAIPK